MVEMDGEEDLWFLVTSALDLSAAQVVEVFTAPCRQAEAIRDHKQRLGMEEGRAWTKEPVLGTFPVQLVALTLLRMRQSRLDQAWGAESWGLKAEWTRRQCHASHLDLRRLFWCYHAECAQFLLAVEDLKKIPGPVGLTRLLTKGAA